MRGAPSGIRLWPRWPLHRRAQRRPDGDGAVAGRKGFTLVETLAALAIASLIIVATAVLFGDVTHYFDRGTRRVTEAERLVLTVDRLAADFGSARFVLRKGPTGVAAMFSGGPAKVVFVGSGGVASKPPGEEMVTLTVEQDGDFTRLVRRHAPWREPQSRFEELPPQDPVVLLDGQVDIAFAFAHLAPEGALAWEESWSGQLGLPRFVRLSVRDRISGSDLLAGAQFVVRADAPAACAQAGDTAAANADNASATGRNAGASRGAATGARPDADAGCLVIAPANRPPSPQGDSRRTG